MKHFSSLFLKSCVDILIQRNANYHWLFWDSTEVVEPLSECEFTNSPLMHYADDLYRKRDTDNNSLFDAKLDIFEFKIKCF